MIGRLLSPFVVGMGSRVAGQVISFATVVVASRHLDLEAFGVYALAWALTVIATTFVYTGYYHALLRSRDFDAQVDTLFWLTAVVGAVGTLGLILCGYIAGGPGSETGQALLILAPLPLIAVVPAWNEAQLVRAERARAASIYVVIAEALGFAALVWGLEQGHGLLAILLSRYVVAITGLLITSAMVRTRPRLIFRRDGLREASGTALPLWGTTAIGMFSNYGADIILAAFLNPAAVGAYRSGSRIALTAGDIVFQPLRMLSWSKFSRLEKAGNRAAIRGAWRENMALSTAILWPCMATIALLAPALVVTIFDESWLPAAAVVTILAISRAVSVIVALLEPTLMCTGEAKLQVKLRVLSGVILLVLLLALGRFGAEWAAVATLLAMAIMGAVTTVVLRRVLSLSTIEMVRTFLPGALATGICIVVILAWDLRAPALGPGQELLTVLALVLLVWGAAMGVFLKRRILTIPTP